MPPQDPEALGRALLRVLQDGALRERLENGARAASSRYDIARCVEHMQDLYDEVLAERGN